MKKSLITLAAVAFALAATFVPGVAAAAQALVNFVGPETIAALAFMGSVATTIVQGDTYTGKLPVNTQPRGSELTRVQIPIVFPTAAPVANDVHLLCKLLPGVKIHDWSIDLDDIDSNGAPAASLSLGEANSLLSDVTVVYKSGITIGQTGGLLRYIAASAAATMRAIMATTLNTERVLALKWDTASATYATGKKGLLILDVSY